NSEGSGVGGFDPDRPGAVDRVGGGDRKTRDGQRIVGAGRVGVVMQGSAGGRIRNPAKAWLALPQSRTQLLKLDQQGNRVREGTLVKSNRRVDHRLFRRGYRSVECRRNRKACG